MLEIDVKAGLEEDKAATLVVLAALCDGQKVILAVESGHRYTLLDKTSQAGGWANVVQSAGRKGNAS